LFCRQNFYNLKHTNMSNIKAQNILDVLIHEKGLRIHSVYFNTDLDMMLVILNNKKVIQRNISDFKLLKNATLQQLENYENEGVGIYWKDLDEDLSLRGFLVNELIAA